jgi:hypothetical protein
MSDVVTSQFKRMVLNVCYSLMAGGITVLVMTIKSFSSNSVMGKTLAYSSIGLSVGVLMLLVLNDSKIDTSDSMMNVLSNIFVSFSPFILLLGVLVGSILITSMNFDDIVNRPNESYKTMSSISSLFIVIQCILFSFTMSDSVEATNSVKMSALDSAKLRLLSIINLIALFSTFVSLKYYTTDGFR